MNLLVTQSRQVPYYLFPLKVNHSSLKLRSDTLQSTYAYNYCHVTSKLRKRHSLVLNRRPKALYLAHRRFVSALNNVQTKAEEFYKHADIRQCGVDGWIPREILTWWKSAVSTPVMGLHGATPQPSLFFALLLLLLNLGGGLTGLVLFYVLPSCALGNSLLLFYPFTIAASFHMGQ